MSSAVDTLDLINDYLERDVTVPPECSQMFLALFSPDQQVQLMSRAMQIAAHLAKEKPSCPLPIAL